MRNYTLQLVDRVTGTRIVVGIVLESFVLKACAVLIQLMGTSDSYTGEILAYVPASIKSDFSSGKFSLCGSATIGIFDSSFRTKLDSVHLNGPMYVRAADGQDVSDLQTSDETPAPV